MSTSTADKKQQQGGGGGGGGGEHGSIQAPPPTPSNHQVLPESISTTTELSLILNQLLKTPTLSLPLPSRRLRPLKPILSPPSSPPPPPPPPFISLLNPNQQTKQTLLSAASHHGFFHLTDLIHIPSHLPPSSLHEAKSLLFSHTHHFPTNLSSLGFHDEEEGDDDEDEPLLVLEHTSIDPNTLPALKEFTECLHRVAMDVLQMLFDMDFEIMNPSTPRCLIWISTNSSEEDHEELEMEWRRRSKCYPYVMCMQYYDQTRGSRARPSWIIGDSGELVPISPRADSLLVTLGDIAQVWSNGKFNKVRSIPLIHGCNIGDDQSSISVSFMVTLPMESTISPLPPPLTIIKDNGNNSDEDEDEDEDDDDDDDGWKRFSPFLMEEYAWRVYHGRFTIKDPLTSYRIQNA